MHAFEPWNIDVSQILTRGELMSVMTSLKMRSDRLTNVQQNLALVRLACCCGLRASEIGGLKLADVVTGISRPYIQVRAETAKGGHARRVPLWWACGDTGGSSRLEIDAALSRGQVGQPIFVFAAGRDVRRAD